MNDDLTILASAYLDGDVTADERAQVESSDELLAEVDRLRTVRALVSNASLAEPAPISMRERHLSGALDAWERLPENERTGALRDSTPNAADAAAAAGDGQARERGEHLGAGLCSVPGPDQLRRRVHRRDGCGRFGRRYVHLRIRVGVATTTHGRDDAQQSRADCDPNTHRHHPARCRNARTSCPS